MLKFENIYPHDDRADVFQAELNAEPYSYLRIVKNGANWQILLLKVGGFVFSDIGWKDIHSLPAMGRTTSTN